MLGGMPGMPVFCLVMQLLSRGQLLLHWLLQHVRHGLGYTEDLQRADLCVCACCCAWALKPGQGAMPVCGQPGSSACLGTVLLLPPAAQLGMVRYVIPASVCPNQRRDCASHTVVKRRDCGHHSSDIRHGRYGCQTWAAAQCVTLCASGGSACTRMYVMCSRPTQIDAAATAEACICRRSQR